MNKHRILIIDDEEELLKTLYTILEGDYTVLLADSGKDGLSILRNTPVSLVILDLNMPGMSGIKVLESIRKTSSELKVLTITAYKKWELLRNCSNLGIQGCIEKPIKPKKLLKQLKQVMGNIKCSASQESWKKEYGALSISISHRVKNAIDYIRVNHDHDIRRVHVARHIKVSPAYLSRLFSDECGMPLMEYINRFKILKSKDHMKKDTTLTIKNVAASVGISDLNYYCRIFKKHTGMTPTQFRKES